MFLTIHTHHRLYSNESNETTDKIWYNHVRHTMGKYDNSGKGWYSRFHDDNEIDLLQNTGVLSTNNNKHYKEDTKVNCQNGNHLKML